MNCPYQTCTVLTQQLLDLSSERSASAAPTNYLSPVKHVNIDVARNWDGRTEAKGPKIETEGREQG